MKDITVKLREIAAGLFEKDKIKYFIGYKNSGINPFVQPAVFKNAEECKELVFNSYCHYNLTASLKELMKEKGTIGILLKGCDARALNILLQQNQVSGSKILTVGIECNGQYDTKKSTAARSNDFEKNRENYFRTNCYNCVHPITFDYDYRIGGVKEINLEYRDKFSDVLQIEEMLEKEKQVFWKEQLGKCIQCYACRNICYACFCEDCIFDNKEIRISGRLKRIPDLYFYHIVRAFHIAGRCIDCGECERVCPVNIPLSLINRKIQKDLFEIFDFQAAGLTDQEKGPLLSFSANDPETL